MTVETFKKNIDIMYKTGKLVMSIEYTTNHIEWLYKYRKISYTEMSEMCDKVQYILTWCI